VVVAIAVTVFTAPPPVVFVPIAVPVLVTVLDGPAGVELGDELSKHTELLEPLTVRRLLEPP